MIEGPVKETITETEKIYEFTSVCTSGTRANVKVIRPILSEGVIADGFDWTEAAKAGIENMKGGDT